MHCTCICKMFKKNRFHFFPDNYVMVIFCLTIVWLLSIHFNRYAIHGFKYAQHFLSLPSIYRPSFISIPFLLNKIWARQATTMKTWLWGDNFVNIQGRSMVLVHCPSSHYHLSLNQVSVQSLMDFQRYGWDRHPL